MEKTTLGKTSLMVGRLGVGLAQLGGCQPTTPRWREEY